MTVCVLLLAHRAQEMPEWERWEISRARTRENTSWETLSPMCVFWQDPPCVRGQFPRLTCWISSLAETPVSTHTRMWPLSHSEVQARETNLYFPLWGIQHKYSCLFTAKLGVSSANVFNVVGNLQLHLPESRLLVNKQTEEGGEWQNEEVWRALLEQLSSCQECKMFPKEILHFPGRQGRKPGEFWHISGSGSENEKGAVKVLIGYC